MGLCKVDCQQGHLGLLLVKCLPSWRELKETFEEDLTSWWGRKILFKCPFWSIGLVHSWGMEEPERLTRPVWVALFSITHCWFSMRKDRIVELVIGEEAGHMLKINPAADRRPSSCLGLSCHTQCVLQVIIFLENPSGVVVSLCSSLMRDPASA